MKLILRNDGEIIKSYILHHLPPCNLCYSGSQRDNDESYCSSVCFCNIICNQLKIKRM